MKKHNLVFAVFSFLLTLTLFFTVIYAYYFDINETDEVSFTLGEVNFIWNGSIKTDYLMPSEELILTPFSLTNQSSVTTEIRFKLESSTSILGVVSPTTLFSTLTVSAGWVLESDGYYYYRGSDTDSTTEVGKYLILTTITSINVLDSLKLDGYVISNNHINGTVNLTLTFEAKQGPFIDWATLGTTGYNFQTGE